MAFYVRNSRIITNVKYQNWRKKLVYDLQNETRMLVQNDI